MTGHGPVLRRPEFVDRPVQVLFGEGHVLETAVERIVFADGGPVDAHGGVDGGLDVLGADIAVAGPAVVDRVGPVSFCATDGAAAFDACAGEDGGLLQV